MELKIVKFFNRLGRGTVIDSLSRFVGWIPFLIGLWTVVAVTFLFLDKVNGQKMFVAFGFASMLYFAISEGFFRRLVVRYFFKRTRPYLAYPDEIVAIGREHGSTSFPSSHITTTVFMLYIIHMFHPEFFWVSVGFVIFTALARMHNGMHYLSDVIMGAFLGIVYGMAAVYAVNLFLN